MAENYIDESLPRFDTENEINYWDAIKLTDRYSNIDKIICETNEEFWNIMPHYMLHLLMSSHPESRVLNVRARSNTLPKINGRFNRFNSKNTLERKKKYEIHTNPMDVFIYVFRKANPLMRQIIANQVSKCQLSLPLIIQDPIFHKPLMFPFAYQNLKMSCFNSEGKLRSFHVSEEKLNIISFIRIGKSRESSKSKLLNELLGFKHSCFFNRGCSGSSKTRLLYDGTIEMNWYLPKESNDKLFEDPLTFLNLRGNAFEFKQQLAFICEVSTVVFIFLTYNDIKKEDKEILELGALTAKHADKICLIFVDKIDEDDNIVEFCNQFQNFNLCENTVIILEDLEEFERANAIRTSIKNSFFPIDISMKLSISDFIKICKNKKLDIIFEDEFVELGIENFKDYFSACNFFTALRQLRTEDYMPLQLEGWKRYAQTDRKQQKLRNEKDIFNKAKGFYEMKVELTAARNLQLNSLSENQNHRIALKDFSPIIVNSQDPRNILKMLTLFRIYFETGKLACLESKTISVQHFIREVGQYYEMCCNIGESVGLNSIRKHIDIDHKLLPQLFARLMLLGEPLELFDGEAQHIPLTWVQDVLSAVADEIGHDKKVFVLGVLGIQSSGKSTLLNTMFGLQFSVASGRCTRGVSMQLISVDRDYAYILKYDYLVILDSEGLKAMEESDQDLKSRDNEFTTLMIGLSDLSIINIMGENFMEWQDIFQTIIISLIKLTSSTKSNPKCLFVHQNISDPNAKENLKEGYQKFLLKLDGVTQFISKETMSNPVYTKFSEIIHFDINESLYYLSSLYSIPPPMSIVSPDYVNSVLRLKKDVINKYGCMHRRSTLLGWSRKLKTVWKSILKEDFVSSYREILERIYYSEFENALHKWSQNFSCEMEKELLLCKDQILNANYEDALKKFEVYEAGIAEKCNTILTSDVEDFNKTYFVNHNDHQIFNNWKTQSEHHFKNTCLDYLSRIKEKLSHLYNIAEQRHNLFNNFYGKYDEILKKATAAKIKLSGKSEVQDKEMFEEYFENEWQNWISDFNLSEDEIPCANFILFLKKEIENLTNVLQVNNEDIKKIKSFYNYFEEYNYFIDVFVIGDNHYRMFDQNGQEIHTAHKYHSWLDYALRKDQKDSDTDFSENMFLIPKVDQLVLNISQIGYKYIYEKINPKFSPEYFTHLITIIFDSIHEFNSKEKNTEAIDVRVQIENVFIYELALYLFSKFIIKFKNKHKPNQMDSLKTQLKSQFRHYYNKENSSSSLACANGLAIILFEKMKLCVAEQLQFSLIDEFSNSNTFSVSSKCHLQALVLTDLANESSFDKYCKYIHEPNQAMKDWIIEKFQQYCKDDSTIACINTWYKAIICKPFSIYREALQQSLKPINKRISFRGQEFNDEFTENSNINSDWKAQLHKKLEGEYTRQFKLSDLDVLLIKPHEITNPSELISLFTGSLQKLIDGLSFTSYWIETYLMADILTTFSDTICRNLFYCHEHCPFCNEPCLSNINSSEHKHYCGSFHRPLGLNGWFKFKSKKFIGYDCTNLKHKDEINYYKHGNSIFDICKQRSRSWDNSSNHYMIESVYWEWVMCNFKDELADHYQYKINDKAIKAWSNLTKSQVLNELQLQMNDFHSPALMWRTKEKIKHFFAFQNF